MSSQNKGSKATAATAMPLQMQQLHTWPCLMTKNATGLQFHFFVSILLSQHISLSGLELMNILFEVGWQGVKWYGTTVAQTGSLPWHIINLSYGSFNSNLLHRSLQIHFRSSKILTLINPHNTHDRADCLCCTDSETGQGQILNVQRQCCYQWNRALNSWISIPFSLR